MQKIMFPALLGLLLSGTAAADCEIDIQVGDMLSFSTDSIEVQSSCDTVTVNLEHTGTLPVEAMGHNWVLSRTEDFQAVANAGMGAGVAGNYVPAGDERVIAATSLVGGGESTSVSFSIANLDIGAEYTFFCSFPGHWSVMKGSFTIV